MQNQEDLIVKRDEGSCDDEYDSIGDYDSDEEDIEEEEKLRMRENALTMNKMAELKRQLQNLSMTRKNKQVCKISIVLIKILLKILYKILD